MEFLNWERIKELWKEVKNILERKQDRLTGIAGQVVGFDETGRPVGYALKILGDMVSVNAEGILTTTQRPGLAQIIGGSNLNLLDNWYFAAPINQIEKSNYLNAGYTIDRWFLRDRTASIQIVPGGISTSKNWFVQNFNIGTLHPGTYTISALCTNGISQFSFGIYTDAGILDVMSGLGKTKDNLSSVTFIIPKEIRGHSSGCSIVTNGLDGVLEAAKLELGEEQTLARQNESGEWELIDPPPERASELLKCQRYQVVYGGKGGMPLLAPGYSTGAVTAVFLLDLPTAMRATPAVSFSNLYVNLSGTRIPVTGAAVLGTAAQNKLAIQVTCSGAGFPANQPCFLEGQGEYRLLLDANL